MAEVFLVSVTTIIAGGLLWRLALESREVKRNRGLEPHARHRCKHFFFDRSAASANSAAHDAFVRKEIIEWAKKLPEQRKPGHPLSAKQPKVTAGSPPPPLPRAASTPRWRESCSVCLEDFHAGEMLTLLPCGFAHVFHAGCLPAWFKGHSSCPLCMTDLNAAPKKEPSSLWRAVWARLAAEPETQLTPHPLSRQRFGGINDAAAPSV